MKQLIIRLFKFGFVGGLAATVYAIFAHLLIWIFDFDDVPASATAYVFAIPVSFFGQKYLTFQSNARARTEVGGFILLQAFSLGLTIAIIYVTSAILSLHASIGIFIVCVIIPLWSYFIMSKFIFFKKI